MTHIVFEKADGTAGIASTVPGARRTPDEIGQSLAHDGASYKLLGTAPDLGGWPLDAYVYDGRFSNGLKLGAAGKRTHLAAAAASHRYELEVGGVTVDGVPIASDRASQAKLDAERTRAQSGQRTDGARWKCGDGQFRAFTNAEIVAIADAVGGYVSALFEVEADVAADIQAGNISTESGVTGAGWPSNSLTTA